MTAGVVEVIMLVLETLTCRQYFLHLMSSDPPAQTLTHLCCSVLVRHNNTFIHHVLAY